MFQKVESHEQNTVTREEKDNVNGEFGNRSSLHDHHIGGSQTGIRISNISFNYVEGEGNKNNVGKNVTGSMKTNSDFENEKELDLRISKLSIQPIKSERKRHEAKTTSNHFKSSEFHEGMKENRMAISNIVIRKHQENEVFSDMKNESNSRNEPVKEPLNESWNLTSIKKPDESIDGKPRHFEVNRVSYRKNKDNQYKGQKREVEQEWEIHSIKSAMSEPKFENYNYFDTHSLHSLEDGMYWDINGIYEVNEGDYSTLNSTSYLESTEKVTDYLRNQDYQYPFKSEKEIEFNRQISESPIIESKAMGKPIFNDDTGDGDDLSLKEERSDLMRTGNQTIISDFDTQQIRIEAKELLLVEENKHNKENDWTDHNYAKGDLDCHHSNGSSHSNFKPPNEPNIHIMEDQSTERPYTQHIVRSTSTTANNLKSADYNGYSDLLNLIDHYSYNYENPDKTEKLKVLTNNINSVSRSSNDPQNRTLNVSTQSSNLHHKPTLYSTNCMKQTFDVAHKNEDLSTAPSIYDAQGELLENISETFNFKSINENVTLQICDSKAVVKIEIDVQMFHNSERTNNVWKRKNVTLTRIIELDLLKVHDHESKAEIMRICNPQKHQVSWYDNSNVTNDNQDNQGIYLTGMDTFSIFCILMSIARGEEERIKPSHTDKDFYLTCGPEGYLTSVSCEPEYLISRIQDSDNSYLFY